MCEPLGQCCYSKMSTIPGIENVVQSITVHTKLKQNMVISKLSVSNFKGPDVPNLVDCAISTTLLEQ